MYEGKTESGTLCGGIVSLSLSIFILAFFGMRTIAVTKYADPAISSHTVFEDRNKMDEPINLAENG